MVWGRRQAMNNKGRTSSHVTWSLTVAAFIGFAGNVYVPTVSVADENGIGFWLPGLYGSLAALPGQPGWSIATIYYHTSLKAGGAVAASREATIGRFSPTVNVNLNANLNARVDLEFLAASYVFQTPVFGGQFALGMAGAFGRNSTSIDGTLTGPLGNTFSGSISDSRGGIADLYPTATIKWNQGVHNFMTYVTGDIPVGTYDSSRLANFGIGHGAIDGGVGYTYLNLQTGHELSVVTGLTYNLKNTNTDYQNGVDWHMDWGLSQFLSKQFHVGAVGYVYQQLTADRGAPIILGDFKSRVIGVGPQIGFIFPVGTMQGYLNFKGYKEFDDENRPAGWNAWVTFAISPAGSPPAKHVATK
jgi:hypothetical protein